MAIYCSQCGAENYQDAETCYHCQAPIARLAYGMAPHGNAPHSNAPRSSTPYSEVEGEYYDPGYNDSGYSEAGYNETSGNSGASGLSRVGSIFVGLICAIYLLNPTAGVDLIPDFIPVVGNLDEAGAVTGLLLALSNLGIIPYRRR